MTGDSGDHASSERGSCSGQSVSLALAEMYVQGVSTRKVIEVLQKLVGRGIIVENLRRQAGFRYRLTFCYASSDTIPIDS